MKHLLIVLALFVSTACSHQPKQEKLISDYLKSNANDPASYEPVSFETPRPGGDGTVLIRHHYRGKNGFGALILTSGIFRVDTVSHYVSVLSEAEEERERQADLDRMSQKMDHEMDSMKREDRQKAIRLGAH